MKEIALETSTNEDSNLKLNANAFSLPLEISRFDSEKDLITFIRSVEKLIRVSAEYRLWVVYVTDSLGNMECALTNEKMAECSLVVHHHPITLYTIVQAIISDFMGKEKSFTSYDIAREAMRLHYQNKVGYMVLMNDLHKKYHDGFQELPIDFVHGDYMHIVSNYTIDDGQKERIASLCTIRKEHVQVGWTKDNYPGLNPNAKTKQLVEHKKDDEPITISEINI